ncbi:hypothetical protein ED312_21530 [Sinomicrobium pectinilyticum]|uniref:Uncharacterized protein n=1 Tax=Sinomicrobium pectinilyticum TaxID=1084421 RepID=A0A3N0DIS1_SINP1|nr:hypothetical protein [Sinomicrobium pectinilyticum]RNL75291.1 hypothetical protein ED312_21530 [Sinomicrobium pectinilyticum]
MKRLQELTQEIYRLTNEIEEQYPELYPYLDENPVTIPYYPHPELNDEVLSGYLDDLKQLLLHYAESHRQSDEKQVMGNA